MDWYNILTVDGGGIRGVISAETLDYMENYAYEFAVEGGYDKASCFNHYKYDNGTVREKMHVKDLFEQLAGTSTGSILSAALSLYKEGSTTEPKFWAKSA